MTVVRDGAWRALVAAGAAASAAGIAAWLSQRLDLGAAIGAAGVVASGTIAVVLAWRASRLAPLELRFDGQHWHVGSGGAGNPTQWQGEMTAMIDLGSWILLRFDASPPILPGRPPRWLPLACASMHPHWHALRCAVFSPRTGADSDAPGDLRV